MNYARRPGIDSEKLRASHARERERFVATCATSARLAKASDAHWLNGVPMHWMRDWSTPHPLFVRSARGVEVEDVDGNRYLDFCFGDTGAMFGHSPPPIARALAEAGASGITAMLPAERVARVGEKLAQTAPCCAGRAPSRSATVCSCSTAVITARWTRRWCVRCRRVARAPVRV
jgi:glutamate-1-semialdehyde 2,1-aminomutase